MEQILIQLSCAEVKRLKKKSQFIFDIFIWHFLWINSLVRSVGTNGGYVTFRVQNMCDRASKRSHHSIIEEMCFKWFTKMIKGILNWI